MTQALLGSEIIDAFRRWRQHWPCGTNETADAFVMFEQWVGQSNMSYPRIYNEEGDRKHQYRYAIRDEAAHKIRLLNGPHYETIIKAWLIQDEVQ